ncbi:NAD(P)H-binding protein [Brevibacterium sp. 5221]|uniref:NAD(P)H-binding protein n=1 Tax=Brevibacterium rongguiense TaxID=2695267 RepID=A0A6N9H7P9_9MICO|nr:MULTISPECIES: NAD(P)H-binding protein [Brevibacterium]MYM19806.1 NAD(P)H-binding protein [Brevibacterium rongguiense]WAL40420.1 NAD(P)H-binding protein [Brevibacterium sp. BRM-1]
MAEKKAVIVGGHGKIALLSAPKLAEAGWSVDSLIRKPEQSADVEAAQATPVVLDIETATVEDLQAAFAGAAAVVFSAGAGGGSPERTHAVDYEGAVRSMDAARAAGVERFVIVSYSRAGVDVDSLSEDDSFYPYAKAKHDADARLKETELDYTILGPGMLTLEPGTGRIALADAQGEPEQDVKKETSRDNVAAVIAYVLDSGAASRRTVNFYDGDTPIAEALAE